MNAKLFKLTFSVDCDMLVCEHNPGAALDALHIEDLIDEIRHVVDIDFNHCKTEEITKVSQIPKELIGSDPYGISAGMTVNEIAEEIEERMSLKANREYADSLQCRLPGVIDEN